MIEFTLPEFPELFGNLLSDDERLALMPITTGANRAVEETLLRAFAYAVVTGASDVHISGHDWQGLTVDIGIRTPVGMVNFVCGRESDPKHFKTKMFDLTATPQGGSTPDLLSTRFSLRFPAWWAAQHGLKCFPDQPYGIDVRVEYAKTFDGWKFSSRIVDPQKAPTLAGLNLPFVLESLIRRLICEPSGLILATGPTGSGKSTLLNAMLRDLINGQNAIVTIEHPVEFRLRGDGPITQIPVRGEVTFAKALRSALRQDPDIILIGEIRDVETMDVALDAASTGHLVFSTLHANSAADAVSRALDLLPDRSRDAFRLAEALKLIMAQRLVYKFETSLAPRTLGVHEQAWLADNGLRATQQLQETVSQTKIGKSALIEAVEIDYPISQVIRADKFDPDAMYRLASRQLQYETLVMAGLRAVEAGTAKLSDCRTKLETNRPAGATPPLRTELAERYNLGYLDVARGIDTFVAEQEQNSKTTLDQVFKRMFT
ncbi:GspE/PulE family protein [Massilia sp.]|uniref:GspE/PulE family protein n=1 Tax=Massilia sp. TaxID=1882437 RepID=UPI00352C93DA